MLMTDTQHRTVSVSPDFDGGRWWSISRLGDGHSIPFLPYLAAALRVLAVPSRLLFVTAATVAFSTFFLRAAAVGAAFFVGAFTEAFVEAFAAIAPPRLAFVLFLSAGAGCCPVNVGWWSVNQPMWGRLSYAWRSIKGRGT